MRAWGFMRFLLLVGRCMAADTMSSLLTDTEFLLSDDRAVAVDVFADQIVEKAATLTYESLEGAGGSVVFVVALEVLGEVLDTDREQSDLAFGAACVVSALAILCENFFLFFS